MKKIRIAIVGAGSRAMQVIYPSFAAQEDVEIVGVCDIDQTRLNAAADTYGITNRYGSGMYDYQRMATELKPDALAIIGQPHIMIDLWQWALENGFNLYIEKPLGLTLHQAESLTYLAEKKKLVTAVSFQRRYSPMVVKLREECMKRGPVVHAVCRFYKHEPFPMTGARDRMMDDCVHSIDTLRWLCNADSDENVRVESHTKRVAVPDINYISAALHFGNGSSGYLINSWSSGKRYFGVEIHSPGIYVDAEHEGKGYVYADGDEKGVCYDAKIEAGSDWFEVYTGVMAAVRDFIDGIKYGRQPQTCFANSRKTMEIAETILAQALLNK